MTRIRAWRWWGGWGAAFVGAALAASPAAASGGKPKPKGAAPAPAPKGAEEKLPAGCRRVAPGAGALISPDGKWIAFARGGPTSSTLAVTQYRGAPIELRLRDPKTDALTLLPQEARPVGWVGSTLLLDLGFGVEAPKGARSTKVASVPAGASPLAVAWSPNGKRLAWVQTGQKGEKTEVRIVEADGKSRALAGTAGLRTDQAVFIAWSPDGAKVYVNALFQTEKAVPVRRVALVDATTGTATPLATMPDWIGIPGLHGGHPAYRDPRIERPDEVEIPWTRPPEPRYGRQVFDAEGRVVAWLAGTGWIEADAFVADVATGEVHRVTNDGEVKWSPALDPAGRRLAFLTADGRDDKSGWAHPRIRVVDLLTGEPSDVELAPEEGGVACLSWTADGASLVYDRRTFSKESTFVQDVRPAKAAPAGATVRSLDYDVRNRVIAWLGSYDEDRVHTAVHRVEDGWDPHYVPALRETLDKWKKKDGVVVHCLVRFLDRRNLKEFVPDLRAALAASPEGNRASILIALAHLGDAEALDGLEGLRSGSKDVDVRFRAAAAMIKAGDERAWPTLEEAARSSDLWRRQDLCRTLAKVRRPRSVDVLILLVADRDVGALGKYVKLKPVGPLAQLALLALTGKSFGADRAAWTAWWKDEAKQVLPENVAPPADPDHELGE
jgi:dipeptidyl aminopeptidase/acylaminoacyl peptidase